MNKMRNKILLYFVALLAVLAIPAMVFSDATQTTARKGRTATTGVGLSYVVGIAELRGGDTWEIDSRGAGSVLEYPKTAAVVSGTDASAVSGAVRLTSISVAGQGTAALDRVDIYDAASATGTPVFEISLGTAGETRHIVIPGGATFSTGVFVDQSANNMLVTITYDN